MHIKPDTDEEKYSEYLEPYRLHALIKKYSDYIRYPIRMMMPEQKVKEGSDPEKPEFETVEEQDRQLHGAALAAQAQRGDGRGSTTSSIPS